MQNTNKVSTASKTPAIRVATFYKFADLTDYRQLRANWLRECQALSIKGTILLAPEGINGTIAGTDAALTSFFAHLTQHPALNNLDIKNSWVDAIPFYRLKLKLKKEIITLGIPRIKPNQQCGTHVNSQDWNKLISDPQVMTIDTRNEYEIAIGTFKNAINPHTTNFRDLPKYVENNLADVPKDTKIAMYCTGGVRCEKSTAYLMQLGFNNVYHLKGGILKYLEETPPEQSLWQGECFVFDNRVAVDNKLAQGSYDQCHGCRHPISATDRASEHYIPGICCPHCYATQSAAGLRRRAERQKQIELAAQRGERHFGVCHQRSPVSSQEDLLGNDQ